MLSVLFVDDDDLELEALRYAFDWEELGLTIMGSASGGEEALALCRQKMPDLLITDLRMPGMDGMELASTIRARNPHLHIVFISGYEDFSIAQNALEIQIDGYLLKPLNPPELLALLQKISGKEINRRYEKREQSRLMQLVQEAKPLLKERFWLDALQDPSPINTADMLLRAQSLGIPIRDQQYAVVVCRFLRGATIDSIYAQSVLLDAEKQLSPYEPVRIHALCYCVVIPFSNMIDDTLLVQSVEAFSQQVIDEYMQHGVVPTLGASLPGKLANINLMFEQAQQALESSFQFGHGRLYWFEEDLFPRNSAPDVRAIMRKLEESIAGADTAEIIAQNNMLFDHLQGATQQQVQSICMELISSATNHFSRYQISVQELFGNGQNLWDKLLHMDTIVDARMWMQNVLAAFSMARESQRRDVGRDAVSTVLAIIDTEYMNDLSISGLAERVRLAPGYMCRLVKNHTGKNLIAILLDRRMKEAQRLLSETEGKVHQVAEKVGYASASYFCRVFHEYTGVTPGEFRK